MNLDPLAPDQSHSLNVSALLLVTQLNALLSSLSIPIALTSPLELTPALLICMLESILSERLPIVDADRELLLSQNSDSKSRAAKINTTKIFLGVLQSDLLGTDAGLSGVDPRRLARGAEEETLFVARLLCWYGRRVGLVPRPSTRDEPRYMAASPSTLTRHSHSASISISMSLGHPESVTTIGSDAADEEARAAEEDTPPLPPPRCIHEIPSPPLVLSPLSPALATLPEPSLPSALLYSASQNPTSASHSNTTVRYTGLIALVDEAAEIAAFEAARDSKSKMQTQTKATAGADLEPPSLSERYIAARAQHLHLLRKKVELLDEMAALHSQAARTGPVGP